MPIQKTIIAMERRRSKIVIIRLVNHMVTQLEVFQSGSFNLRGESW